MQINADGHPDDEIRIGLLCPAQGWKGLCTQASCARHVGRPRSFGRCCLNGAEFAAFCKIPVSHPVSQQQRAMRTRDPAMPLQ